MEGGMWIDKSRFGARARLALLLFVMAIIVSGCGGTPPAPALGDNVVSRMDVATQSGNFQTPLDSAPDSNATNIYFTAGSPSSPGVFRVPADGGAAVALLVGKPFVAPTGIAVSSDDQHIYVADPQSDDASGKVGQIFVIPASGGAAVALAGSAGTAPRIIDVVNEGGQEMLYFTGNDPTDGQAGVFKLPAAGAGAPTVVAKGAPLVEPEGVTVTQAGVAYVTDRSAAGAGFGSVFKIAGGIATKIVERVRVGSPAGLALTKDDAVLLVSALQPDRESDQVLLVKLDTLETGSVTKVIAQNQQAGGVHRARNRNVFSWIDRSAGGSGKVYRIEVP
jgi:DNA-binding beta-propeller fold protein YncE